MKDELKRWTLITSSRASGNVAWMTYKDENNYDDDERGGRASVSWKQKSEKASGIFADEDDDEQGLVMDPFHSFSRLMAEKNCHIIILYIITLEQWLYNACKKAYFPLVLNERKYFCALLRFGPLECRVDFCVFS